MAGAPDASSSHVAASGAPSRPRAIEATRHVRRLRPRLLHTPRPKQRERALDAAIRRKKFACTNIKYAFGRRTKKR